MGAGITTEDLERYLSVGYVSEEKIIYNWELNGPEGADFFIYPAKWHTQEEIKRTKNWLRDTRDVIGLYVCKVDCEYPFGREYIPLSPESREAAFRVVLNEGYQMIDGYFVDRVTANAVVTIMDNLKPENKDRYIRFPVNVMVDLAWKLIKKCSV